MAKKIPTTLAIDTSCDETSASVVRGTRILSNVKPSQVDLHKSFGGVVPSIARLAHQERIVKVVEKSLRIANCTMSDIDFVSVTSGPGLAIALEVGINYAKELAQTHSLPLMQINHMEGHLFSSLAQNKNSTNTTEEYIPNNIFPSLGLLVSGKHTELVLVEGVGSYTIIGETLDDACGEAFDKAGRLLGLGYPSGGTIGKFAKAFRKNIKFSIEKKNISVILHSTNIKNNKTFSLPIPLASQKDTLNLSYSGLKTAFNQIVEKEKLINEVLDKDIVMYLSTVFEEAAFLQIENKIRLALQKYKFKSIIIGGGVSASARLRFKIRKIAKEQNIPFFAPTNKNLTTDNAAMIGFVANMHFAESQKNSAKYKHLFVEDFSTLDRIPRLSLERNIYV